MELPLSISNLQEQWLLSFLKKLDPANITELFWQLRPYVVLHHVEFKESSFSFSSVGIINFVDIVGFVRKNDTLGILLRNGCFYLFSAVSRDRQCILVCDPEFLPVKRENSIVYIVPVYSVEFPVSGNHRLYIVCHRCPTFVCSFHCQEASSVLLPPVLYSAVPISGFPAQPC